MAGRRFQKGRLFLRGKKTPQWIGRWREDIITPDGSVTRIEKSAIWRKGRPSDEATRGPSVGIGFGPSQRAELSSRACCHACRFRRTLENRSVSSAKTVYEACGGIAPESPYPARVGCNES